MLQANKKNAALAMVGGTILALSANAHAGLLGNILPRSLPHVVMTFDFAGEFTMFDPTGGVVANASPAITGTIMLDAFTFGGTAAMEGAFFGSPWTTNGDLSAYIGLLSGDKCGGALMCAHSNMDFAWNGNLIPVQAAFSMTPVLPGLTDLLSLNVGVEFAVESIDTDLDGVKGTVMTVGPFLNFTPNFTGTATLVGIKLLGSPIANPGISISPVPEPSEWAMMLVGVGLIGSMAYRRQKRAQAIAA